MAILQPSLLPGLEDGVLLKGLKEMQILETKTSWIIVHGPGMEFPLGPNLPKFHFTSNGLDKRARTDYLSMYDYMARVYVPKPSDVHPNPHARVGASQYRSMFDYMLTEHRARVKRRSRRIYERPSVIYKRGLPAEQANSKNRGIQSSRAPNKWVESQDGKSKGVEINSYELIVEPQDDEMIPDVTLIEEVLSSNSQGVGKATEEGEQWTETASQISSVSTLEIEQLEEDISIIATERRLLDEIRDEDRDDEWRSQ